MARADHEAGDLSAFMGQIATIRGRLEIWRAMRGFFAARGFPILIYQRLAPASEGAPGWVEVQATGLPNDWAREYVGGELWRVDPIIMQARQSLAPFHWLDIGALRALTAKEALFVERMMRGGLGDGLAIQAFGPGLEDGYIGAGFGGARRPLGPRDLRELQAAAQIAHLAYAAAPGAARARGGALSPREREVLTQIARGLSNAEIAEALGVSYHTVDSMVRRIFAKLEARDRTTATVRGLASEQIRLLDLLT